VVEQHAGAAGVANATHLFDRVLSHGQ